MRCKNAGLLIERCSTGSCSSIQSGLEMQFAAWIGRSVGWVKKWGKRLREAPRGDGSILLGKPRGRKTPYPQTDQEVQERVVAIRDAPPENLRRVPGQKRDSVLFSA